MQPQEEDYFVALEEVGNFDRLLWALHPGEAFAFDKLDDAETMAKALILPKHQKLLVCELHRSKEQVWVKAVKEVFSIEPMLN